MTMTPTYKRHVHDTFNGPMLLSENPPAHSVSQVVSTNLLPPRAIRSQPSDGGDVTHTSLVRNGIVLPAFLSPGVNDV